jgi:cyclophilin family peptidyl-prolyl cis-trans isomerase
MSSMLCSRFSSLSAAWLAAAALLAGCGSDGGGINETVPGVTASSHSEATFNQQMVVTLEGRHLDLVSDINVSASGCTQPVRSTAEPYVSSDTKAYYTCTVRSVGSFAVNFTRISDAVTLASVAFTVAQPPISVTSVTHATPFYSQAMLITLEGQNLDAGVVPTAGGCAQMVRSTTEPYVSSATTAYYRCLLRTVGTFTISFAYGTPSTALGEFSYTVPEPEVTLKVSNDNGVTGDIVLALEATKAPITVRNFLGYVNSSFYTDTVFHRLVPDFIIQGGGYAKTITPGGSTLPTQKATGTAITLEDNVGLSNLAGTIAMARTGAADSATSQFFFNLVDNTGLDYVSSSQRGYAVFGHIATGLDVLAAMVAAPCTPWPEFFPGDSADACLPNPNLYIVSATQTR